jgi:hypothetical protein
MLSAPIYIPEEATYRCWSRPSSLPVTTMPKGVAPAGSLKDDAESSDKVPPSTAKALTASSAASTT